MDKIIGFSIFLFEHVDVIANVVATALAAYSIRLTVREQKNIRENEKVKFYIEQDLNWYNTVALNDIVLGLNLFIDKTEQELDLCEKGSRDFLEDELKKVFERIREDYKSLSIKISQLEVFSIKLYRKCNNSLSAIFDFYSEVINDALVKKYFYNRREVSIQNERIKIIKELYFYKGEFINRRNNFDKIKTNEV